MDKLRQKSLSGDEILKIAGGKAKVITYPELRKYNRIEDAFDKNKALIIIYLTRHNYGHWTCLFEGKDKRIEFFDSYGLLPDDEIKFIPEIFRRQSGQYLPHLTWLLYNSNRKIHYNNHKLQKDLADNNTCGRHVGLRLLLRDATCDEYAKLFKGYKLSPDEIVTIITEHILNR